MGDGGEGIRERWEMGRGEIRERGDGGEGRDAG